MAKPDLNTGDKVLVIDLKDKQPGKRLMHRAEVDEIKSKSNKKVKLKKTDEEFDEKGNKEGNPKRRFLRLSPAMIAQITASPLVGSLDNVSGIDLDDSRLTAWDKENEV